MTWQTLQQKISVKASMQRITHHIISQTQTLSDWLPNAGLSHERFAELVEFGAVYLNKSRLRQPPEHFLADDYLRIHRQPRRFKVGRWKIVHETQKIVIVDKPGGLPSHPTLDNANENMKSVLESHLHQELFLPHRLDTVTTGLLLFTKDREELTHWAHRFESREIDKFYLAVTRLPLQPRVYSHHMLDSQLVPKTIVDTPTSTSKLCQLEVLSCQPTADENHINRIRLLTGRTHQIRAQLAHLGRPILHDDFYALEDAPQSDSPIALVAHKLEGAGLSVELKDVHCRLAEQGIQV